MSHVEKIPFGMGMVTLEELKSTYFKDNPATAEKIFADTMDRLTKAKREGKWRQYVFSFDNNHRISPFIEVGHRMNDREYWALLGDIWTGARSVYWEQSWWLELFTADRQTYKPRGEREFLMSPEDRAVFTALPDPVTVYRGVMRKQHCRGMSWTIDAHCAAWFGARFESDGATLVSLVPKRRVLAYFSCRNEAEVVIDPRWMRFQVHVDGDEMRSMADEVTRRRKEEDDRRRKEDAENAKSHQPLETLTTMEELLAEFSARRMNEESARKFAEATLERRKARGNQ